MSSKSWLCRYKVSRACLKKPKHPSCQKEIHRSKEAMIVVTAKERSSVDGLDNFLTHYGSPMPYRLNNGTTSQSVVNHAKMVTIQGRKWMDSMQLSSEIPFYYTRYLATINGNIAVLATFTAHKKYYSKYSGPFFQGINSLVMLTANPSKVKNRELSPKLLARPLDIPLDIFEQSEPSQNFETTNSGNPSGLFLFLAIALAGIGIFLIIKRKQA